MTDRLFSQPLDTADDCRAAEYRSVSILAIVACLFGVASAAAILGPMDWLLPTVGLALGLFALRRIAQTSTVCSAVIFATAAAITSSYRRHPKARSPPAVYSPQE